MAFSQQDRVTTSSTINNNIKLIKLNYRTSVCRLGFYVNENGPSYGVLKFKEICQ